MIVVNAGEVSVMVDGRESVVTIGEAWSRLSRLGAASRYSGRCPDGRIEVLLSQPVTGQLLAAGRGETLAQAICAAVTAAHADVASSPDEKARHQNPGTGQRAAKLLPQGR